MRPFVEIHGGLSAPDVDAESASDHYANRFAGPVGDWFLDVQARTVEDLLTDLPPPCRVLDVGGGHAQITPQLVDAGYDVTVLGSDPVCGERLRPWTRDGRCQFEVGSLRDLPFGDLSFDVAISFRILTHIADPPRLISELCRVARRSVILDYASHRSLNLLANPLFPIKIGIEGNTRRFAVFSPGEIQETFESRNFQIAVSRPQYLLPMALHRFLGSALLSRGLESPGHRLGITRAYGSPVIVRADRKIAIRIDAQKGIPGVPPISAMK